MEHSKNPKTKVSIYYLPSCEINGFLDSISIQESQKQKNGVSKTSKEKTKVLQNVSNLPPSCELVETNKDNSNE